MLLGVLIVLGNGLMDVQFDASARRPRTLRSHYRHNLSIRESATQHRVFRGLRDIASLANPVFLTPSLHLSLAVSLTAL